jgi:hypothetical protein
MLINGAYLWIKPHRADANPSRLHHGSVKTSWGARGGSPDGTVRFRLSPLHYVM